MAAQGPKSAASLLLLLNLVMYIIMTIIAVWALNYGINETPTEVQDMTYPARLFPIYYPIGNMATGFFVIFTLIAGLVGIAASLAGLYNVLQWRASALLSASAYSIVAWGLTLLAMGLAFKEISLSPRTPGLRAMETLSIVLSVTQFISTGALHLGVTETTKLYHLTTGRV